MNAVISGTAGQALLIDGESLRSLDVQDPSKLIVRQQADLPYLFGEGRDLRFIENTDLDSIVKALKSESDLSLALDLTLISLDDELEEDIRKDAIRDLDELVHLPEVRERLEGIMYARPLPDDGDLAGATRLCDESRVPKSLEFFEDLNRRQPLISSVSEAWDVIPTQIFGGYDKKSNFQLVAVRQGLSRSLVISLEGRTVNSVFLLNAGLDRVIQQLPNYREILLHWSAPFREPGKTQALTRDVDDEFRQETTKKRRHGRFFGLNRITVLKEVNKRKESISAAMRVPDLVRVQELVDDLVLYQRENGETEHAAKSLCDLATDAKELGLFPLQLELTERSITVAPADGWSWAQYGAALLNAERPEMALRAYEQAESFGNRTMAKMGRAEVLKAQGEFQEALATYSEVVDEDPWNFIARRGRAAVLKSMGDFEGAIAAYDAVIRDNPWDMIAKNGRAEALTAQHEFERAIAAYNEVIQQDPAEVIANAQQARVLKAQSELDEFTAVYGEVMRQNAWEVVVKNKAIARNGKSCVLAALGRYQEGLELLPHKDPKGLQDWIGYHILGMIRLRTGKTAEAIRIFDEGVRNDPWPSSRQYFSRALALAWLRGRDFQKASDTLETVRSPLLQPVANVLRIHAFGAQGKIDRASIAYESLSASPHLRSNELTQELHDQFILMKPPRKTEEWILDKEAEIILLAA